MSHSAFGFGRRCRIGIAAIALVLFWIAPAQRGYSQITLGSGAFPPVQYYMVFGNYYQGEYRSAFNDWKNATGAYRIGSNRFLDSCCYWTMAGECQFQTGNYAQAIDYYEQSLALYLSYAKGNWQNYIQPFQVPNLLPNAVQNAQISWGQPARAIKIPRLPDTFEMVFGELGAAERALQQGGAVLPAEIKPIGVAEIMRCTAIGMHRRRWIKGALCKYEPLTLNLATALERANKADGSLLGAWNGVLLGIAYHSIEDYANAKRMLENSLVFGGGLEHPLTPIALLELAEVNFKMGDTKTAAYLALEASYSAAVYNQFDVVEEALSFGTMLHLATKQGGVYPPLENAVAWSRRNRAQLPQTSLSIRVAECLSEAGDAARSAKILGDSVKAFNARSGFGSGSLNGRANYLSAVNLFQEGAYDQGLERLGRALKEYAPVSRWLFQLALTERYAVAGTISERHAEIMYQSLLRDPTELEWRSDPIEAVSFLASPHLDPIRRWMGIVASQRNFQKVIEIGELYRRHLFYSALPLAGRGMALRWVMNAPPEAISRQAMNQRVDFQTRYPVYKGLSDQMEQLRLNLLQQPMKPEPGSDEQKNQVRQYVELMKGCQQLESMLGSIALRREPAEMVFPPQPNLAELAQVMEPNQTVVYVLATPTQHLFFEYTTRGTRLMSSINNRDLASALKKIFRETELEERQLNPAKFANVEWQALTEELGKALLTDIVLEYYGEAPPEVIIVPDGLAWYLPFEMLRVPGNEADSQWLWEAARVRYSPTLGLAIQPQRKNRPLRRSAFFTGRLSDQVNEEKTKAAFQTWQQTFPAIVDFDNRMDIPSAWLGSTTDEFIVLSEMGRLPKGGPFAMTPVQKDRGSNGSNLASWLSLPWQGAEHLILPVYESEGASGLRGNLTGDELFLLSTGLYAAGARTILLSRWPTGGKSCLDFTAEYWTQSKQLPPAVAFQEAIRKMQETPLDFKQEPRVAEPKEPLEAQAQHPLFWAGYMLFDLPTLPGMEIPEPENADGEGEDGENADALPGEGGGEAPPVADGQDGEKLDEQKKDGD